MLYPTQYCETSLPVYAAGSNNSNAHPSNPVGQMYPSFKAAIEAEHKSFRFEAHTAVGCTISSSRTLQEKLDDMASGDPHDWEGGCGCPGVFVAFYCGNTGKSFTSTRWGLLAPLDIEKMNN